MNSYRRAKKIVREDGARALIQKAPPYVFQRIWPHLPESGHQVKNGIQSSQKNKALAGTLPAYLTQYTPANDPDYEEQYIRCIREYISLGEHVVLVGGGEGISTVAAARQVGTAGEVDVFEGGSRELKKTKTTAEINGVSGIVTAHHTVVSDGFSLRSSASGAETLCPTDLPECNALGIDADGAEIPILEQLSIRPATLIVEHHAVPGDGELIVEFQPGRVRSLIQNLGYYIVKELSDPVKAYDREERIFVAEQK